MLPAIVAFAGALVYGGADFLGGLAARRLRAVLVTAVAAAVGILPVALVIPWLGGAWIPVDVAWGALSGVTGAVAIMLLYACLALGPMSILSPLAAVVSAIAPMLWGLLVEGEVLGPAGYAGLAVAVVAVALVGVVPGDSGVRPSARGLLMAVGAGLAIGAFLVLIDRTSPESGMVPLLVNRGVNAIITGSLVVALIAMGRRRGEPAASVLRARLPMGAAPSGHVDVEHALTPTRTLRLTTAGALWCAVGCGLADAGANILALVALRTGDLAVVSALTALYPAGTILLAAIVLRERIARMQGVGLMLALGAGVLLALG